MFSKLSKKFSNHVTALISKLLVGSSNIKKLAFFVINSNNFNNIYFVGKNVKNINLCKLENKVIEMKKADYETAFEKITKEDNENPITQNDIPEEVI